MSRLAVVALLFTVVSARAWFPGPGQPVGSSGYSVDPFSRADVVSFFQHIYQASEGSSDRINWQGDLSICGTISSTSPAYKEDTLRRINYYRAMVGLPADLLMDSSQLIEIQGDQTAIGSNPNRTQGDATHLAAEMMAWEFAQNGIVMDHEPPTNTICYTPDGWNGAANSLLALGAKGPEAIDAYMLEPSGLDLTLNPEVGHRRWLLYSLMQTVATADIPAQVVLGNQFIDVNATYVITDFKSPAEAPPPKFVTWPNEGYFPQVFSPVRWSITYPGADFRSASVTVVDESGQQLNVTPDSASANQMLVGDNTLSWTVSSELPDATSQDRSYTVTVSNILGSGIPDSYTYVTTFMNPNRVAESLVPVGPDEPIEDGSNYYFDTIQSADSVSVRISEVTPLTWVEGAEDATLGLHFDDLTNVSYDARYGEEFFDSSGIYHISDDRSWRLTFGSIEDTFGLVALELKNSILPQANTRLNFSFRRGYQGLDNEVLEAQYTTDGETWLVLPGSLIVSEGSSNSFPPRPVETRSISIPNTGLATRVRFVYRLSDRMLARTLEEASMMNPRDIILLANSIEPGSGDEFPTGIFLDDITLTNTDSVTDVNEVLIDNEAEVFELDATLIGQSVSPGDSYYITLVPQIADFIYSPGVGAVVTYAQPPAVGNFEFWRENKFAILGAFSDDFDGDGLDNGVEYAFSLDPLSGNDAVDEIIITPQNFELRRPLPEGLQSGVNYQAEWSTDLAIWNVIPATFTGGLLRASIPTAGRPRALMRWRITED